MHRLLRILSTALITAGLVVLADAALTLLWQEPVSAAYASLQQSRASDELAELESEFDPGDVGLPDRGRERGGPGALCSPTTSRKRSTTANRSAASRSTASASTPC